MSYLKKQIMIADTLKAFEYGTQRSRYVCVHLERTYGWGVQTVNEIQQDIYSWLGKGNQTMGMFTYPSSEDIEDDVWDEELVLQNRIQMLKDLLNYYSRDCATPLYNSVLNNFVEIV